jgi:hypothetical protein
MARYSPEIRLLTACVGKWRVGEERGRVRGMHASSETESTKPGEWRVRQERTCKPNSPAPHTIAYRTVSWHEVY